MRNKYRERVLYKFVVYQIKTLVTNNRGKTVYMDSFDRVILDLYGVKNLSRKISESYDDREIMDFIDKVGLDQITRLLQNTRYCNAVRDLIRIDDDCEELAKEIRKLRRKGKRSKSMIKEYNELKNLYKRGIKNIKKRLGIKSNKKAYKYRYNAVKGLLNEGRGWDGSFREIPMDDDYDYDPYDDDDYYRGGRKRASDPYDEYDDEEEIDDGYDPENASELETFCRMMNGPDRRRAAIRQRIKRSIYAEQMGYDEDDDFDYDPYDEQRKQRARNGEYEDDDPEFGRYRRNTDVDDIEDYEDPGDDLKYEALYDKVAVLADVVQALASQREYDMVNHRDFVNHRPRTKANDRPVEYPEEYYRLYGRPDGYKPSPQEVRDDYVDKIAMDMTEIKVATSNLVKAMSAFEDWRQGIDEMLAELAEDYDEDDTYDEPVVSDENPILKAYNKYPDIYETPIDQLPPGPADNPQRDPKTMSRAEVIDEINRTQPQKSEWSEEKKPVKMVTSETEVTETVKKEETTTVEGTPEK